MEIAHREIRNAGPNSLYTNRFPSRKNIVRDEKIARIRNALENAMRPDHFFIQIPSSIVFPRPICHPRLVRTEASLPRTRLAKLGYRRAGLYINN